MKHNRGGVRPTWEKEENENFKEEETFDQMAAKVRQQMGNIRSIRIDIDESLDNNFKKLGIKDDARGEGKEDDNNNEEEKELGLRWDDPRVKEVLDFTKKLFPDQEQRNFLVKKLGDLLDGPKDNRFLFDHIEEIYFQCRKNESKTKLIIFDMNGMFTFRVYNKLKKDGSNMVDVSQYPEGSEQVWNFLVWKRPGVWKFMDFLFEHCDIAVWSSMSKWNLDQLVDLVFGDRKKKLKFIWDQSKCKSVKHPTSDKKPLFLKTLSKVYEEYPEYTDKNVLLVDDTEEKARENSKYSLYKVDEWKGDMDDKELMDGGSIYQFFVDLCGAPSVEAYIENIEGWRYS